MTASPGVQGITPAATGWMTQQRCAEVDSDLWFQPPSSVATKAAKRICATCPVMVECRAWALADDTLEGVAGGLTQKERAQLRGPLPDRCNHGHVRTDTNTRIVDVHGHPSRRCLTCDTITLQRKGRTA